MFRRLIQNLQIVRKIGLRAYLKGWWKFREIDKQGREVDFYLQCLFGQYKRGRLEAYAETGTEGFVWAVSEDGKKGYYALNCLVPGDVLMIFAHDGKILFNDIIEPDTEAGYRPYPLNPEFGQPSAFGCWIHWTQRGWKPDDWAALFFERFSYRAILVKKDVPKTPGQLRVESQPPIQLGDPVSKP
jgi:hypothetical protein